MLPINYYYGISVLAKIEVVLILIPQYAVFSVYRPTLLICCWAPSFLNIADEKLLACSSVSRGNVGEIASNRTPDYVRSYKNRHIFQVTYGLRFGLLTK